MHPAVRASAITLVELIVVVAILVLLYALIDPLRWHTRRAARKASCGNHQKQIVLAMLVYGNDNLQAWPARPTDTAGHFDPGSTLSPSSFQSTAIGSLEFLVVTTGNEMFNRTFQCPANYQVGPRSRATAQLDQTTVSSWTAALAGDHGSSLIPAFCYDWSVPANADAARVVLPDRAMGSVGHQGSVEAGCADGHASNLTLSPDIEPLPVATQTQTQTQTWDGHAYVVHNPDAQTPASTAADAAHVAIDDNIFDGIGDAPETGSPRIGAGSATRAWVH